MPITSACDTGHRLLGALVLRNFRGVTCSSREGKPWPRNLPEIQTYLGHCSLSSTGVYVQPSEAEACSAFAAALGSKAQGAAAGVGRLVVSYRTLAETSPNTGSIFRCRNRTVEGADTGRL